MRRIRKHALAESDLIGIWQYSFEQWNAVQADNYLDELESGIRQLADNPEMGAERDYVRGGLPRPIHQQPRGLLHGHAVRHPYRPRASRADGSWQALVEFDG